MPSHYRFEIQALKRLAAIEQFWDEHNQSTAYSTSIRNAVIESLNQLLVYPDAGRDCSKPTVKVKLILNRFLLCYRKVGSELVVLDFLDGRSQAAARYRKR